MISVIYVFDIEVYMEKIDHNVKERKKAVAKKNNKKNYNISLIPIKNIKSKGNHKNKPNGRGHHKRQGGNTASRAMANSATITCTVVKDPNSEVFNRFAVMSYPAKGIEGEIIGPFENVFDVVQGALAYLKPLFDNTTENLYVKFTDGTTRRYSILGGNIQHG